MSSGQGGSSGRTGSDTGPRSSTVRGVVFSSGGLAFAVIFNLGIQMLADAWSDSPLLGPLQAVSRVLLPVFLLVLIGWVLFGRARRAAPPGRRRFRFRLAAEREPPVGPATAVRPGWVPPRPDITDDPEIDRTAEKAASHLAEKRAAVVTGEDRVRLDLVAAAVAYRMTGSHTIARFDVTSPGPSPAYAVACTILRAFGLGVPGCTEEALDAARRRLAEVNGDRPLLLVLTGVEDAESVAWLLKPDRPSELRVLVTGAPDGFEGRTADTFSLPARGETVRPSLSELAPDTRTMLRALAELPLCPLGADAIAAVDFDVRETDDTSRRRLEQILTDLVAARLLETLQGQDGRRYRLPPDVHAAARADGEAAHERNEQPSWAAAEPAVLAHYADLTARWSAALDSRANAAQAALWFRSEEPILYRLVTGLERTGDGERRSDLVMEDLARIGSALDIWYARENQPDRALAVFGRLRTLADEAGHPVIRDLSAVRHAAAARRLGRPVDLDHDRPKQVGRRRLASALYARTQTVLGLEALDTDDLDTAARRLRTAWLHIPRADVRGEVCVLVDLAVVHLYQGRLDRARERLDLAASLTESVDPSGRGQILELQGIVAWCVGERHRAVDLWTRALEQFAHLRETDGEARCLQHLGTVVLSDPRLARPGPGDVHGPIDEAAANEQAIARLERSRRLRPGRSPIADMALLRQGRSGLRPDDAG